MADISKIKLPNGNTYNIKDSVARAAGGLTVDVINVTTQTLPSNVSAFDVTVLQSGCVVNVYFDITLTAVFSSNTNMATGLPRHSLYGSNLYGEYVPYNVALGSYTGKALNVSITQAGNMNMNLGGAGRFIGSFCYMVDE